MTRDGRGNVLTAEEREALAAGISALAGSTIFSVEFLKKDGSARRMTCRLGVPYQRKTADPTNDDPGRALTYSQVRDKGLLPVFEMVGKPRVRRHFERSLLPPALTEELEEPKFKCFDLETLQTVRAHGRDYRPEELY